MGNGRLTMKETTMTGQRTESLDAKPEKQEMLDGMEE